MKLSLIQLIINVALSESERDVHDVVCGVQDGFFVEASSVTPSSSMEGS